MKFRVLAEYEYPVAHKPPVKAELVLHGDTVTTSSIKPIEREPDNFNLYKLAYEKGKADGQEWCTVAPPDVGEYLVTIHDWDEHRTYVDIGEYDEDGWNYKGFITVKAWMPLPTPYKQEEQG